MPILLHVLDHDLPGRPPGPVDRQIVQDLAEPGAKRSLPSVLSGALQRPHERVLHQVGVQVGISGDGQGEPVQGFAVLAEVTGEAPPGSCSVMALLSTLLSIRDSR